MGALPVLQREMALAARRPAAYWMRFWAAALVAGIFFSVICSSNESGFRTARMLFAMLGTLAFGFCLLAGVRYTSDSLSSERREGTLGLLFLTDLKAHDVVAGKLGATSLNAVFLLLAIFPLLGLPVLLGGVSGASFFQLILLLLNTLFLSLSLGLLVSALGRDERSVVLGTLFLILGVAFGLPALHYGVSRFVNAQGLDWLLLFPSPFFAQRNATGILFGFGASNFWPSMTSMFLLGAACAAASVFLLPRNLDGCVPSRKKTDEARAEGLRAWRSIVGRTLLDLNPFLWVASRRRRVVPIVLVTAGILGFTLWTAHHLSFRRSLTPPIVFIAFGLHLLVKFLIASEAARQLAEDRRSGAMELVLCAPVSPAMMVSAQWMRAAQILAAPVLALILLNMLIYARVDQSEEGMIFFRGAVALLLDCSALTWVAMRKAVAGVSFVRSIFLSMAQVLGPGWVLLFLFFLAAISDAVRPRDLEAFLNFWLLLMIAYDVCLVVFARRSLRLSFRALAAGESIRQGWVGHDADR